MSDTKHRVVVFTRKQRRDILNLCVGNLDIYLDEYSEELDPDEYDSVTDIMSILTTLYRPRDKKILQQDLCSLHESHASDFCTLESHLSQEEKEWFRAYNLL